MKTETYKSVSLFDCEGGAPSVLTHDTMARNMRTSINWTISVACLVSACAFTPGAAQTDDPSPDAAQATDARARDASTIDGPPGATGDAAPATTLRETSDDVITSNSSVACNVTGGDTAAATWYRVFRLSDFGVVGPFEVSAISFAVDRASSVGAVTISIGTYSGTVGAQTLTLADVAPLASAQVAVSDGASQTILAPIAATIPAGGTFVVSVSAPSLVGVGYFHFGATDAPQTLPGYFGTAGDAPTCNAVSPPDTTTTTSLGHVIIEAIGR